MIMEFSLLIDKHDEGIKFLHSKAPKHTRVTREFCIDSQNKSFSKVSKQFSHLPLITAVPLCVLKESDMVSHNCEQLQLKQYSCYQWGCWASSGFLV